MTRTYLNLLLLFLVLLFLQVGVFNSIHLFGIATPVLFVYFILKLPVEMNRNSVLLLAAFSGFIIDLFTSTLGLNMLALTVVGFSRYYMIRLFGPREVFENMVPSISSFGRTQFLTYSGFLLFVNLLFLFGVESLTLFNPLRLILQIVSSLFLSLLIVYGFELIYQALIVKK
ncbi:rod shape-determining protein MreD [Bacteroidales bacterium OttesenSCG-928-A17]|nr:rod shape-determining protein MreD [Bacteroidales bacterium OttesenSCG-928-A17]